MSERDIVERLRKWEDRRGNVTPGELMDEAASEIARLREERRWVPVGERLPEVGVDVLAMGDEGVFQARLALWGERHRWEALVLECHGCGCCGGGKPSVTHWQPLPPGPEANG